MQAANQGDSKLVKLLIDAGADAAIRDNDGGTALDYAKAGRKSACIRILQSVAVAGTLACQDGKGRAATAGALPKALGLALTNETRKYQTVSDVTVAEVRAWLESGGHVDSTIECIKFKGQNVTTLMLAAHHGDVRAAQMLMDHGADPLLQNEQGHDAIMAAKRGGHQELGYMLLESLGESGVRQLGEHGRPPKVEL